ncbi:MAG: hypothetical protein HY901_05650 [Deltaproteobacteria bacterium]|nr:hypothetical protein [Deltaproteobacteria bacterium]
MSVREGVPGPVAVVGAGLTGASWAGLFAAHGREVRLYDSEGGRAAAAVDRAAGFARFLVVHGLADAAAAEVGLAALRSTEDLAAALAGVVLMQECVVEDLAVKRAVFAEADRLAPPGALLATRGTSSPPRRIWWPRSGSRCSRWRPTLTTASGRRSPASTTSAKTSATWARRCWTQAMRRAASIPARSWTSPSPAAICSTSS